jgi:hypothetical protein
LQHLTCGFLGGYTIEHIINISKLQMLKHLRIQAYKEKDEAFWG